MLVLGLNVTGRRWNFKGGAYWGCVLKRDGDTMVVDSSPPSLSACPPPHPLGFPSFPSSLIFQILAMRSPFLPSHDVLQAQSKNISWSQAQTSKTKNQNRVSCSKLISSVTCSSHRLLTAHVTSRLSHQVIFVPRIWMKTKTIGLVGLGLCNRIP